MGDGLIIVTSTTQSLWPYGNYDVLEMELPFVNGTVLGNRAQVI